jgi:hypothetical protein
MLFSLNCLVLGQDISKSFNIPFGNDFPVNSVDIEFENLTVANFKDYLFSRRELQGITAMNIWKVEIGVEDINNFSTEDNIRIHGKGKKVDDNPMLKFKMYYNNKDERPKDDYLNIFIVPTSYGKRLPTFYLSNKKFALSHIYFIIRAFLSCLSSNPPKKHIRVIVEQPVAGKRTVSTRVNLSSLDFDSCPVFLFLLLTLALFIPLI